MMCLGIIGCNMSNKAACLDSLALFALDLYMKYSESSGQFEIELEIIVGVSFVFITLIRLFRFEEIARLTKTPVAGSNGAITSGSSIAAGDCKLKRLTVSHLAGMIHVLLLGPVSRGRVKVAPWFLIEIDMNL